MTYETENNKVVGVIEKELGGSSAKIKAIGIISEKDKYIHLTDVEARVFFPPNGFLFEPGFFHNHNFKVGDVISFWAEENYKAAEGYDKFKIKHRSVDVRPFGINARRIKGFKKTNLVACLESLSLEDDHSDGVFYGLTDKYVIGKLRTKSSVIEPALHHRIQIWDRNEDMIVSSEDSFRLLEEPTGDSIILDCMNDKQLFEWFRSSLKQLEPDYVKLLDTNASWRTNLPTLFSKVDKEKLEADRIRIQRVEEKFELIDLSNSDIKTLVNNSEKLNKAFQEVINNHKEEYKLGYKKELELFELEIENKKEKSSNEAAKYEQIINEKKETVTQLTESLQIIKDEIERLSENKERIIEDFSIIKEVLKGECLSQKNTSTLEDASFVFEELFVENCDEIININEIEEQLKFQLFSHNLNARFSKKILDCITNFAAVLVKDIRIGIAMAKATNNSRYIIQQVEPDWLHFKDFWHNGLGAIWESAHNHPENHHFLILEDINMSAPECYCRPLVDMITGIRTLIPYGKSKYPDNLKIIASYASFEEPEIGLPLNQEIFEGWGAVGFRGNIYENGIEVLQPSAKIFKPNALFDNSIDDFTKLEIENDIKNEFELIFR